MQNLNYGLRQKMGGRNYKQLNTVINPDFQIKLQKLKL